jgi:putative membrane protein
MQLSSAVSAAVEPSLPGRRVASWGLTLGLLLFITLLVYHGVGAVSAAAMTVGSGIVIVTLSHLLPLVSHGLGWRQVMGDGSPPPVQTFVWGRWLAESVNDLLPVLQVGGNLVRGRALADAGVPLASAAASVVVDITLIVSTQLVFTLIGLTLLALYLDASSMVPPVMVGIAFTALVLAGFVLMQRYGLFGVTARLLERLARSPEWLGLTSGAVAFDAEVHRLYRNRAALGRASAWHLLAWLLGAAEVWLALYFLGHPVSVSAALMWESLGEAIRTAAFAIPGAFGVQEGGYLLFGRLVGVPPDVALALSLVRRVRELLLGVPGLVAWRVQRVAALSPRPPRTEAE